MVGYIWSTLLGLKGNDRVVISAKSLLYQFIEWDFKFGDYDLNNSLLLRSRHGIYPHRWPEFTSSWCKRRQKSSGAEGGRLKEAANINKSLSTLGYVGTSISIIFSYAGLKGLSLKHATFYPEMFKCSVFHAVTLIYPFVQIGHHDTRRRCQWKAAACPLQRF